jgi:hypothetical protein
MNRTGGVERSRRFYEPSLQAPSESARGACRRNLDYAKSETPTCFVQHACRSCGAAAGHAESPHPQERIQVTNTSRGFNLDVGGECLRMRIRSASVAPEGA